MKKLLIYLVLSFSILSCQKEYPYPTDDYSVAYTDDKQQRITHWGKFLVVDAVMYVENHETGTKYMFNHFDDVKVISSMRWGGSYFDIENISKNVTTWSFYRPLSEYDDGVFVLNDDEDKHYRFHFNGPYKSIIEDPIHGMDEQLMGGSARPYSGSILDYKNKLVSVRIQESEGSIDGYNCRYWTQLTLQKVEEW